MNLFQDRVNYRRTEVSDAVALAWPSDQGLREVSALIQYMREALPYDEVAHDLAWRVWGAVSAPTRRKGSAHPDVLRNERDRIGRWIAHLGPTGCSEPANLDELWFALDRCFDPEDDQLEHWAVDIQDDLLEEITEWHEGGHEAPPEGEPPIS